ncbi:MAG: LysM domain-containing protein [Clostridiales bacterium]|nr:LysM domain-containing protein [Clostridiales bacterium]
MSKAYTTVEGDTFDSIALKFYNDEKLASTIISANPDYCDRLIFEAGITLVIPGEATIALPESLPPWRRSE